MMHSDIFADKVVFVTGGTGSFGKAFVRKILTTTKVAKVIVFSRDELKQWEMRESEPIFADPRMRYFLGDIRDCDRLKLALKDVHIVVHTAALKQVPAAEYNPSEFIKTNVQGAMNLITAAIEAGVEQLVALSSDKAVNPINLYGATKLCSDKLFIAAKSYVGKRKKPVFAIVRYGNVLGSRGSLLPYWEKLMAQGASTLPITHPKMTRFWITLDAAVDFVFYALSAMQGGEIFVPKIPSVNIVDMANVFAKGVPHTCIGIRPGEKIDEVLISSDDALHTVEIENGYIILPPGEPLTSRGTPVPEGFTLASNTNPLFIHDLSAIEQLLQKYAHRHRQ